MKRCFLIFLSFLIWSAAIAGSPMNKVNTPFGAVILKIGSYGTTPEIYFNNKLIEGVTNDEAEIVAAYPSRQNARLLLFQISGGTACPATYQILEIRSPASFSFTQEFGDCSFLIDSEAHGLKENPVYKSGEWQIAIPSAQNDKNIIWFVYKNGTVTQNGKKADILPSGESEWTRLLTIDMPDPIQRSALIKQYGSAYKAYKAESMNKKQRVIYPPPTERR